MSVETILVKLIKNGDKETINDMISLLEFIRDYKKPVQVKESRTFQKPAQQTQQQVKQPIKKPVQQQVYKPVQKSNMNEDMMHASDILDAHYENGGTLGSPKYSMEKLIETGKMSEEDVQNLNHADALL